MKQSKHNQIKRLLETGASITGLQAMERFNVYRLSSVINRLRNSGMDIETVMVESGNGVKYAVYQLVN